MRVRQAGGSGREQRHAQRSSIVTVATRVLALVTKAVTCQQPAERGCALAVPAPLAVTVGSSLRERDQ